MDKFQARWKVVLVSTDPMDLDEVDGKLDPFTPDQFSISHS
jgi:hypothetical protein